MNVKSAPTTRQVSALQKRSKSPEASRRKSVVDQRVRKEQLSSAYGNQKVIIPRKSKAQQSREERAKRARERERGNMLAGLQKSVAVSQAAAAKAEKRIEKKNTPTPSAAEIWENRNKDIVRNISNITD